MAQRPEVFVRALEPAEAQRLVKITRTARVRVRLRRAGIALAEGSVHHYEGVWIDITP